MSESLRVELGERSYPIHIGAGLLSEPALFAPPDYGSAGGGRDEPRSRMNV